MRSKYLPSLARDTFVARVKVRLALSLGLARTPFALSVRMFMPCFRREEPLPLSQTTIAHKATETASSNPINTPTTTTKPSPLHPLLPTTQQTAHQSATWLDRSLPTPCRALLPCPHTLNVRINLLAGAKYTRCWVPTPRDSSASCAGVAS